MSRIVFSGQKVAEKLAVAATNASPDDLYILTIVETLEARIRSYELLAEQFSL